MAEFDEHIRIRMTCPEINATFDDIEKQILSPLYCIWESGSEWIMEFDLPLVDKKDISVSSDESNTIIIDAKLRETYCDVGIQRKNEFNSFQKSVTLPGRIDLKKTTAKFARGRLIVRAPKLFAGTKIQIL